MNTFAQRLKTIIRDLEISQTELAKKCGITQQSISYIINNNLTSSKLAPLIAAKLRISPDWLIYGIGQFKESKSYEIPVLHSVYMLKKFLNKQLNFDSLNTTFTDTYLGEFAFAYLIHSNELLICHDMQINDEVVAHLTIDGNSISVTDEKHNMSFSIFEKRSRYIDY